LNTGVVTDPLVGRLLQEPLLGVDEIAQPFAATFAELHESAAVSPSFGGFGSTASVTVGADPDGGGGGGGVDAGLTVIVTVF
jgi:hypothetical protein